MKHIFLAIFLLLPSIALADNRPAPTLQGVDLWQSLLSEHSGQTAQGVQIFNASCCKVCRKGYACGNSCISRDKSCHQPPGCACDG